MKKTAITILKTAVSVGILILIFRKVDINELWRELRAANAVYAGAAVLLYLLVQAFSAYRWYLLLRPIGVDLPYRKILSYYLLGMYFNFFLPTAIGGDAVRIYYLHKETQRLGRSTASVFLDRDIGLAALLAIATVAAAISGTKINGVLLAPIFLLIAIPFTLANLALFYRPSYNLLHRLLNLFRMKKADEKVESLFESVNSYRGKWGLLSVAMLVSIVIQAGGIFANLMLAYSIGIETRHGWLDFLVFIPVISLISMNPLSVNGTGWREYSYVVLFGLVGAKESQTVALALLWVGVLIITSLPGGIIYVLRGLRAKDRLPTDAEMEEQLAGISSQPPEEEPVSTV